MPVTVLGSPFAAASLARASAPGMAPLTAEYCSDGILLRARPKMDPAPKIACVWVNPGTAAVTEFKSGAASASPLGRVSGTDLAPPHPPQRRTDPTKRTTSILRIVVSLLTEPPRRPCERSAAALHLPTSPSPAQRPSLLPWRRHQSRPQPRSPSLPAAASLCPAPDRC